MNWLRSKLWLWRNRKNVFTLTRQPAAGDLLACSVPVEVIPPPGWSRAEGQGEHMAVYYKIADGTESRLIPLRRMPWTRWELIVSFLAVVLIVGSLIAILFFWVGHSTPVSHVKLIPSPTANPIVRTV